jgi:serine phosphatase RsbU (regulator of sigma subunit)
MLKIAGGKVQMSSAGMPPIFIYKNDERVIEEHVIKGMPLGTMQDFPYVLKESEINSGDSILIMSDGFPELLNDEKEAFGYKRVRNLFEEHSAKSPEDIISVLRKTGDDWTNNREPDDDITFVVIKVK